jgi:preprotein translocase subunit YajC
VSRRRPHGRITDFRSCPAPPGTAWAAGPGATAFPEDSNVPFDFLITAAHAQAAPAAGGGSDLMAFLPMIAIFVVFYFLLIRPQQKRAKETKAMLQALQKGDEVVTAGGVVGKVTKLTEQYASVEIAPNVEITVQRAAVAQLLPKGTIKAL